MKKCTVLLILVGCLCYGTALFATNNEIFHMLPDHDLSTFRDTSRTFWQHELPSVLSRYVSKGFVASGGIHGTAGSCTSPSFATDAMTGTDTTFSAGGSHVTADGNGGSASINYATQGANCANPGTATVEVAVCAVAGNDIYNWHRMGLTNYFTNYLDAKPILSADCAALMHVSIVNGAITAVADRRLPASAVFQGVYDVSDPLYGAKCDNNADDSVALSNTITALRGAGGGIMAFPVGRTCLYNTTLSFDDSYAITVAATDTPTGGIFPTTVLQYTGVGTAISARSTAGFMLRNLYVYAPNIDATHFLLDAGHSATGGDGGYLAVDQATLRVAFTSGGVISLDKANSNSIERSHLMGGVAGIRGAAADGGYSNMNTVSRTAFHDNVHAIVNGGDNWSIIQNTFEGTGTNFIDAFTTTGGYCGEHNMTWSMNWFGDSPATTIWIKACGAHNLLNNSFAGGQEAIHIVNGNPVTAFGNTYAGPVVGIVLDAAMANDIARFYSVGNLLLGTGVDQNLNNHRPYISATSFWSGTIGHVFSRALQVYYSALNSVFIGPSSVVGGIPSSLLLLGTDTGQGIVRNGLDTQSLIVAGGVTAAKQSRIVLSPKDENDSIEFAVEDGKVARFRAAGLVDIGKAGEVIAAGSTITVDACGGLKQISSTAAVSTNTVDTFTTPGATNTSCMMTVCNSGGFSITLKHNARFKTVSGVDLVLAGTCCVPVVNFGSIWVQSVAANCSS